jgi:hypothetical protein
MVGDDSTLGVKRVAEVPEERAVKMPSDCRGLSRKKSESVKGIYR